MNTGISRVLGTMGLLSISMAALADTPRPATPHEPIGFVTGGVIGGFALGPVGAVLGAGIGTWIANRVHRAGDAGKVEAAQTVRMDGSEVLDGMQDDVLFRTGSAEITPENARQIQVLALAVAKSPALKVRVDGFADPRGTADSNLKLSEARANAVRDLFLDAGVSNEVLEVNAHGKTQSVAVDSDGFALERRVRLTLRTLGR